MVLDYEFKSHINCEMNRGGAVSGEAKDGTNAHGSPRNLTFKLWTESFPCRTSGLSIWTKTESAIIGPAHQTATTMARTCRESRLLASPVSRHDGPNAAVPDHFSKAVSMTLAEQTTNLQQFGYSHREASFLVTVALHSGYFLARQFAPRRAKQPISFPGSCSPTSTPAQAVCDNTSCIT